MFFIMGMDERERILTTLTNIVCASCGAYTSAELIETAQVFTLFFIPLFRFNKRYTLRTRCCGATYEAEKAEAERIRKEGTVDFSRLRMRGRTVPRCPKCGAQTDYPYCPFCGTKMR